MQESKENKKATLKKAREDLEHILYTLEREKDMSDPVSMTNFEILFLIDEKLKELENG